MPKTFKKIWQQEYPNTDYLNAWNNIESLFKKNKKKKIRLFSDLLVLFVLKVITQ